MTFAAAATAKWKEDPAPPSDVGYTITVAALVLPPEDDAPCEKPPASTRLFINSQEAKP